LRADGRQVKDITAHRGRCDGLHIVAAEPWRRINPSHCRRSSMTSSFIQRIEDSHEHNRRDHLEPVPRRASGRLTLYANAR
jgi:hypothetical protein